MDRMTDICKNITSLAVGNEKDFLFGMFVKATFAQWFESFD